MKTGIYTQPKDRRDRIVREMRERIITSLKSGNLHYLHEYAASADTYVRKWAYTILGRLYREERSLQKRILSVVEAMSNDTKERVRQTAVYAAGEIGHIRAVRKILERGLRDGHHSVRNGVIGTLKVMGSRNPQPVLAFARKYMKDKDAEVRRQIVHGIELHGRTHPQEVLPILREMQDDTSSRVRKMIVHVLGQISYKKGCLETVIGELKHWKNASLVGDAVDSILSVHREQTYCVHSYEEARDYIRKELLQTES